jgi:hypothetical protein
MCLCVPKAWPLGNSQRIHVFWILMVNPGAGEIMHLDSWDMASFNRDCQPLVLQLILGLVLLPKKL